MNSSPSLEGVRRMLEEAEENIRGRLNEPWVRPTSEIFKDSKVIVLTKSEDKSLYLQTLYPLPDSAHRNIQTELHVLFKESPNCYLNSDSCSVSVNILENRDFRRDVDASGSNLCYGGPSIHCAISFKNVEKMNCKREFFVVQITKGREYHEYDHKYCSWICVSEVMSGIKYSLDKTEHANPWYSEDSYCVIGVDEDVPENIDLTLEDVPKTDIPMVMENNQLWAARRSQEFVDFIMMRVSGEGIKTKEYLIYSFKWFFHFDWRKGSQENHDYGITGNNDVPLESMRIAMKYPNINDNQLYYSICKCTGQYKIEVEPRKMTL